MSVFKNKGNSIPPKPTTSSVLYIIFSNDTIPKMVESIESFKKPLSPTSTTFQNLDLIKKVLTGGRTISFKTFTEKYETIKSFCYNQIKDSKCMDGSKIKSSDLYLKYVQLRAIYEFNATIQRIQLKKGVTSLGITNPVQLLTNLCTFHSRALSLKQLCGLIEKGESYMKPFYFPHNGEEYYSPIFSLSSYNSSDNLSELAQSLLNEVISLYRKAKQPKTDPQVSELEDSLRNLSISKQSPKAKATSPDLKVPIDLFVEIFKSNNLGTIIEMINGYQTSNPHLDFLVLKDLLVRNQTTLKAKIETMVQLAKKDFMGLNGKYQYQKDSNDSQLFNGFITLRIMFEVNCIYKRNQIKSIIKLNKSLTSVMKSHLRDNLDAQNYPVPNPILIVKTVDPMSYEKLSKDYSFFIGHHNHVIACLNIGHHEISNSIQNQFIKLCNWARNGIPNSTTQSLKQTQQQTVQASQTIVSLQQLVPKAAPVIQSTSNFLLVKVFENPISSVEIFGSIVQLYKTVPQHIGKLNNILEIINNTRVQFNSNLESIRNRLTRQIMLISNTSTSRGIIFAKTYMLMVLLEFNKIFQMYELKNILKTSGGKVWNNFHSELSKHQKSKLSFQDIFRGKYLDSFSNTFVSTSTVNGNTITIPTFECGKFEKLPMVTKLLFNEIYQMIKVEPKVSGSNVTGRNSGKVGGGRTKNVLIRDQVDVISMKSDEIIEVFLKSSPSRLSLIQANNITMLTDEYQDHQAYKHSFIPILTEEFRAHLENSFNEISGVEIDEDGIIIGLDYIKMNQSIDLLSLEELSDQSINVNFFVKLKDRQDELCGKDLLLFKCFDDYNRPIYAMGKITRASQNPVGLKQFIDVEFIIELEALENVTKSPLLFPLILRPDIDVYNRMVAKKYEMPSLIQSIYTSSLNDSQLSAVTESLCVSGITLIQGPPGTGKTHTIHSLISILLAINPMFKILICAPSHAAVDEVAKRVLKRKLINAAGVQYLPNMVRVGREEMVSPDVHCIGISKKGFKERKIEIRNASIVYSTLSSAGSITITKYFRPSIVIVDESTQSAESSTIIPLGLGISKLILVGDPLQLPPTIFSKESNDNKLNVSLFERLSKVLPVTMLNVQYRMHPLISRFPSNQFYRDKLKDGDNVKLFQHEFYNNHSYGPIAFFDIVDSQEERGKVSVKNILEIEMIFTLIKKLVQDHPICKEFSIGIITPYKLQRKEIEDRQKSFNQRLDITCNTVDGFQGAEKDIIIFSCVRNERIGFLSDRRRINVGITRAKYGLFIIGNKKLLSKDRTWGPYIAYIDSIKRLTSINSTGISKLKQQTIQYDLLHPDGLLTEFEQLENEEFENQIENSNSTSESDISDSDDKDDIGEEIEETTGSSKMGNQEEDDDDIEDDDSSENEQEPLNELIDKKSLVADESYPSIIINIIKQLQNLNGSGKIDTTFIHNKKLLRENFKKCCLKFENYINNVLKPSSVVYGSNNKLNSFTSVSNQLNSIVTSIECKKRLVKEESFNRLKKLLLDGFATCTLDIYGSFISGLSLNDSDIDVNFTMQHKEDKSPLNQVSSFLKSKTGLYKIQEKRLDAKVPIIRFKDLQSNIHFDMCSNSSMSKHNSMLLREYVGIDSRVKPLILLVKWWAYKKDLNDASMDTFSSFCLVSMVIHFLQSLSPPVIPNLQNPSPVDYDASKIQLKANIRVENYLIKYYDYTTMKFNSKLNTFNIGQLFYKFFLYYSTFNYKQLAISISKGIYDRSNIKKSKFIVEDPFIDKNIAASLRQVKFNNYLIEITLMEYQLRNNISDVNELFNEKLSLFSNSLNARQ